MYKPYQPAEPLQPRDRVEFDRLGVDSIEPHDIIVRQDRARWTIIRLLGTRDPFGNLRYACLKEDKSDAQVWSINTFTNLERPDITPPDCGPTWGTRSW